MNLVINGEKRDVSGEQLTVAQLLSEIGLAGRPVAVEVNKHLVFKRNHESTIVQDGDAIEIVTMVGGG